VVRLSISSDVVTARLSVEFQHGLGTAWFRFLAGSCCLPAILILAACAPRSIHNDPAHLSQRLREHTSYGLRERSNSKEFAVPPGLEIREALNETDAVTVALWNNAGFQESLTKLGFSRADLLQAGLLANPTLSMLFPWGPKQFEFTATFPLEALYLRPRRVKMSRIEAERTAESLLQSGLDLIRDVRFAFTDVWLAQHRLDLNTQALAVRETLLEIAISREKAGEGTGLELAAARLEAARAVEEMRRSEHDLSVFRSRLVLLMGSPDQSFEVRTTPIATNVLEVSSDLEKKALAARPDLRASELAMEAAATRAGLAKTEIFLLSGLIDANGAGKQGFEIGPGVQLPIPIFHQNQAGRARASAELERAGWNYVSTRQRIIFEVRDAFSKLNQASQALNSFQSEILPSVQDLAERSRRAYELGDISPLAVHEYSRQWISARLSEAELTATLRRAWTELERSVGTRLKSTLANP
jgi:cobalt-zinc-cadmium efflux system outer membrane protein